MRDVDLEGIVERTAGASPAYIKELLRKAAVLAAVEGAGVAVTGAHLEAALTELNEGGRLAQRILGFRSADVPSDPNEPMVRPPAPTGFPAVGVWVGRGASSD